MRDITFIKAAIRIFCNAVWRLDFKYAFVILDVIVFGKRVRR